MTIEKHLHPNYDADSNNNKRDSDSDDEAARRSKGRADPAQGGVVFSCLGLFIQILTSTTGLFIINLFFLLLGSYIFYLIEAPKEEALQNNLHSLRETLVDQLIILGHGDAASYDGNASEKLAIYEGHLANFYRKRATLNIDYGNSTTGQTKLWTAYGAIIYCYSIITTIGWGNIVASTLPGRMATIVYGLFGMPLLFTLSTDVGNIVSFCNLKLWLLLKHIYKKIYRLTVNKDHHHYHHHHHHHHGKEGKTVKADDDDDDEAKTEKTRSSGSLVSKKSQSSKGSRSSTTSRTSDISIESLISSRVSLGSESVAESLEDISPNRYFSEREKATGLRSRNLRNKPVGFPGYMNKAKNNAAYLASVQSTIDFILEFSKLKGNTDVAQFYPHKRILCKHDAVKLSETFDYMTTDEIVKCMEFAGFPKKRLLNILEDMHEKDGSGGNSSSVSSHTLSEENDKIAQPETVESVENETKIQVVSDIEDDHASGYSLKVEKWDIVHQIESKSQSPNRNDSKPSARGFQKRTKLTQTVSQPPSSNVQGETSDNIDEVPDVLSRSCSLATANTSGGVSEGAGDLLQVKSSTDGPVTLLQQQHGWTHTAQSRSEPCLGDDAMKRNGRGDGEVTRLSPKNASHFPGGFTQNTDKTGEICNLVSEVNGKEISDGSLHSTIADNSATVATSGIREDKDCNGTFFLEKKELGAVHDTAKQTHLTDPTTYNHNTRTDKTGVQMDDEHVDSKTKRLADIFNTVFQVEQIGFNQNEPKFNVDDDNPVGKSSCSTPLTAANLSKHNSLLCDAPPKYEKHKLFPGQRSKVYSTSTNDDYGFVKNWKIQSKKPRNLLAYPAVFSAAGNSDILKHISLSVGRKPEAKLKEKQLIDHFVSVDIGETKWQDLDVHRFTNSIREVSDASLTSNCQVSEKNYRNNPKSNKITAVTLGSADSKRERQTTSRTEETERFQAMDTQGGDPEKSRNLPKNLQQTRNKKFSDVQGGSVNLESVSPIDANCCRLRPSFNNEINTKPSKPCIDRKNSISVIDRKDSIPENGSKQPAHCIETLQLSGLQRKNEGMRRSLGPCTDVIKSGLKRVSAHSPLSVDYNQSADEYRADEAKRAILAAMMKKKKKYLSRGIDKEEDEEEEEEDDKKDEENQAEDYHLPLLVLYAFVILYVLIGSSVYYTLSYDSSFTFLDAIYFIYVLLSTTGFGDILPELHMYYFSAVYGLLGMAIFNVLINATLETLLSALDYINAIAVAVDNEEYFDDGSGSEGSYD